MLFRKVDLSIKYDISTDRLDFYEEAGLLVPIKTDDHVAYSSELRVAVIAKAESLGFPHASRAAALTVR